MPGTKKRVALFDEQGHRIKGKENQSLAEIALAKAKVTWGDQTERGVTPPSQWLVAICNGLVFFGTLNGYFILITYSDMQDNPYEPPRSQSARAKPKALKSLVSFVLAFYRGSKLGIFLLALNVCTQLFSIARWGTTNNNNGRPDSIDVFKIGVTVSLIVILIGGMINCVFHFFEKMPKGDSQTDPLP